MRSHTSYGYGPEPSRARHLLVLAAAALALVLLLGAVVGVIGLVTSDGPDDDTNDSPATSTSTTGGPSGSGEQAARNPGEWETDPDTELPIGATSRDGHPVGFPNTEVGAAALVVELNRAQIGLDYDTALTTIRVYAAPEDQAFFDALATSAVDQRRKELGVPGGGEVNAPAGYAQTPIGYQVEEYGQDHYLVSVLNEVTTTTANGQVNRTAYVGQQFVQWTPDSQDGQEGAGDWQLVEPSDADRTQLLATPVPAVADLGSAAFEQAGWSALLDSSGSNTNTNTNTSSGTDTGADNDGSQ